MNILGNCVHVRKSYGLWEITCYKGSYTCVYPWMSQYHHQLDSNVIASTIMSMVCADLSILIAVIVEEIQDCYTYQVSYKKV